MTEENFDSPCRCGDVLRFPLADQTELIYSKDSRQSAVFPAFAVQHLLKCREFKTLGQHAQNIRESSLARTPQESILDALKTFLNGGFLVYKKDILERIRRVSPGNEFNKITSICIPTRNRVESLKRALASFIENTQKHGRHVNFIVADHSDDKDTQQKYRQALKDLKDQYGANIYYAGEEEKKEFARALISRDLPSHVVDFALFGLNDGGSGAGANRNALFLAAVGEKILMTDDDTVCRLTNAPGAGKTLTFLSGQDTSEHCFYTDQETLLKTVPFSDEDILSIHEKYLGKDLGTCLSDSDMQPNFDRASAAFLRRLCSHGGNIRVTQTGLAGDSGTGSPTALLSLTGESRGRFLKSESDYRKFIMSRLELCKASFPSVTDGDFCMTTSLGLDLENFLPPFVPVHRNSDGIFGAALRACFRDGYIAHLPWAVLHLPLEESRSFTPENIWDTPVDFQIDEVVSYAVRLFNAPESRVDDRSMFKKLGEHLTRLATLDAKDFEQVIVSRMLGSRKFYLEYLQNSLKLYKQEPVYWAEDVKKRIHKIISTLENGSNTDTGQPESAWSYRQNLVAKFGELISYWPEIVDAASILREQGRGIAQPV